jgi:hypothetical protein
LKLLSKQCSTDMMRHDAAGRCARRLGPGVLGPWRPRGEEPLASPNAPDVAAQFQVNSLSEWRGNLTRTKLKTKSESDVFGSMVHRQSPPRRYPAASSAGRWDSQLAHDGARSRPSWPSRGRSQPARVSHRGHEGPLSRPVLEYTRTPSARGRPAGVHAGCT